MLNISLKTFLRGFSLVELLISLIAISCIIAAFMPVITKKAQNKTMLQIASDKSGLMIYTNPGTYSFDVPLKINTLYLSAAGGGGGGGGAAFSDVKNLPYTSSTSWTVPKGVNQITFTITGSGGGGGAANGSKNQREIKNLDGSLAAYTDSCLADEFLAIRGSVNENDLCYTKRAMDFKDEGGTTLTHYHVPEFDLKNGEVCLSGTCCWDNSFRTVDIYGGECSVVSGLQDPCTASVCTYSAANSICSTYKKISRDDTANYRLPFANELEKVMKYIDSWSRNAGQNGLGLATANDTSDPTFYEDKTIVPWSYGYRTCIGAKENLCAPYVIWGYDVRGFSWSNKSVFGVYYLNESEAFQVRCVHELSRYIPYSGSGGAAGAQLTRTINVLPNDVIEFTVGKGGEGGVYNTNKNNGIENSLGNGTQGKVTQILHKRNGEILGTYSVQGAFGGFGATSSYHGKTIVMGSLNGQTTPLGTCYSKDKKENGNVACSVNSFSGKMGSSSNGGNGAIVNGSSEIEKGSASSGGYLYIDSSRGAFERATSLEISKAKGQNASSFGSGGGGGFTPPWAINSSNFYQGGNGASGKIDISYKVVLPGGGGGAGASVGIDKNNQDHEIIYKVNGGTRIVFTVGKGGKGGAVGQNGSDGEKTVIGKNDLVFNGGSGGKTATLADKTSLEGGSGGMGGELSISNPDMKLKNSSSINLKGNNGFKGQAKDSSGKYLNFGFDGGNGGITFLGYFDSETESDSCGGGIIVKNNATYNCQTKDFINGFDAKLHDAIDNKYGGSGGGGGGAIINSFELGKGGDGANGYLRIRY